MSHFSRDRNALLGSLSAKDLLVLRALLDGARTAREVTTAIGSKAWPQLRWMELCEPSLVTSAQDPCHGEVWSATALGAAALG